MRFSSVSMRAAYISYGASEVMGPGVAHDMGAGRGFMPGLGWRAGLKGGHLIQLRGQVTALLRMAVALQPGVLPCLLCHDARVMVPVQQSGHQILGVV